MTLHSNREHDRQSLEYTCGESESKFILDGSDCYDERGWMKDTNLFTVESDKSKKMHIHRA